MKFLILIASLIFACQAKPVTDSSYIQQINVIYENELWTCGTIACPATQTFGCHVQMFNNPSNNKLLTTIYTCIDDANNGIIASGDTEEMDNIRTIHIDLWSFVGAETTYTIAYYIGGHEIAFGVIAPNMWEDFKQVSANFQTAIEDAKNELN